MLSLREEKKIMHETRRGFFPPVFGWRREKGERTLAKGETERIEEENSQDVS